MPNAFPPSVRVIVRGWLNCNQVLLLDESGHVLIDSGYAATSDETLRLLAAPERLGERPLARVINTHCHADHVGGNAALVRRYGCTVTIPAGDAANVRAWNRQAFLIDYADHFIERFDYTDTLAPGDRFRAGGLEWEAIAAPGHDVNALVYWCQEHGIAITGDALWENGFGALFPLPSLEAAIEGAHATLDRIEALGVRRVIPGHGRPFADVSGALARARRRLEAFRADPAKNARHVMKSLLAFALLAKRGMRVEEFAPYCARVSCYADLNERFIGKPLPVLAELMLAELRSAGVVAIENGWIRPRIPA
ncbi:MAG TPA: MBL fold metallo-hydrolase [Burkholderiales bacterium]